MRNPFIIMFVGKTHSGKTSTARALEERLGFVTIDIDDIDQFIKTFYPQIVNFEKENRKFYNIKEFTPFLKLQIQSVVLKYSINSSISVILSNGNGSRNSKDYQRDIAKKLGVKLIGINLKIKDEVIRERIKTTKKDLKILTVSKDFYEVLEKQSSNFEYAVTGDADLIFNVDASNSTETIVTQIERLLIQKNLIEKY